MYIEDDNLRIIEQKLRFISRHSQTIEGRGESDFEAVDEICMAVISALRALDGCRLSYQQPRDQALASAPVA
ncbi:MAG: hypothetical protein JOZ02_05070 [Acidobacteria bacterium]|nr:hypothetical protein [Acidobacteriota bacterium]